MSEKIKSATPALLRVALGLLLLGLVAGAPAGLYASTPPSPCYDFVTGGGWFTPRSPEEPTATRKINFGFNAGFKGQNQTVENGHFNLVDRNPVFNSEGAKVYDEIHIDSTSIVAGSYGAYSGGGVAADRFFQITAKVNGVDGYTFLIEVVDTGEPGNAPKGQDRIIVSGPTECPPGGCFGYRADSGGFPGTPPPSDGIDGGNIQIHKPCDGVNPR
ncbi:MAG TPA: post-COAP-1 domain-containing protein [Vicinamibacteria bacterium]|jgi:hypothetical protein